MLKVSNFMGANCHATLLYKSLKNSRMHYITIEVQNNKLVQRTVRRSYYGESDYQDSTTTEVLMSFEDFKNE